MSNDKKPKWDIGAAITAAAKTYKLADTYRSKLENRLLPDDLETLKAGGAELSTRHSGQSANLSAQKSKTLGQKEAIELLNSRIISIYAIIKSSPDCTSEIRQAFGIGERIIQTADGMQAAVNKVVTAYNVHTEISHKAGLIDADVTELGNLSEQLTDVKDLKNNSIIIRKLGTMDKTTLHRTVENLVSKVSAIGNHVFAVENPALAALFRDLIPSSGNGKEETAVNDNDPKTTTNA